MKMRKNKSLKTAGILLAVFFSTLLSAQEAKKETRVETVFDEYHRWGITSGLSILFTTNEPNAVDFKYHDTRAWDLGVFYNFYQIGNFNFKVSVLHRQYKIVSSWYFTEEETGYWTSWVKEWAGPNSQFRIPVTVEYFLPLGKILSFNVGLGPEFTIYPKDLHSGSSLYYGGEVDAVGWIEKGNSTDPWLYVGVNASIGLNIETGPLLLQPTLTYHWQPKTLYTNVVTTQNLKVPNTVSTHTITGNYVMFGLSVSPSRDLFKKKEKAKHENEEK